MSGFQDVTLSWDGDDYKVAASNVFPLVAKIEDALVGNSGVQAGAYLLNTPPYARLAAGYGAALRHAGASVTDEEIYLSITDAITDGDGKASAEMVQESIYGLLSILFPNLEQTNLTASPDTKKKKRRPAKK